MLIETTTSDYYGVVNYRLVGIVDLRKMLTHDNFERYMKWSEKFHHRKFFHSHMVKFLETPADGITKGNESFAIFIPVYDDNTDWQPKENNIYYKTWINYKNKRQKELPITEKLKRIEKWQNSWPEILTPDYFEKINTNEDLFFHFNQDIS